jgi:hypothetical protein
MKKAPHALSERGSRADLEVSETNPQAKHILPQRKIGKCDPYHILCEPFLSLELFPRDIPTTIAAV